MLEFEEEARLEAERRDQARREADNEEKIKGDLLDASLEEVLVYGWTKAAVSAACVKLGYPSVVAGLVNDAGVDLVLHHIKTSNRYDFYIILPVTSMYRQYCTVPFLHFTVPYCTVLYCIVKKVRHLDE